MKWISVKDRLPEKTECELLLLDDNIVYLGLFLKEDKSFWNIGSGYYREYSNPDYWILMQDVPKPKEL